LPGGIHCRSPSVVAVRPLARCTHPLGSIDRLERTPAYAVLEEQNGEIESIETWILAAQCFFPPFETLLDGISACICVTSDPGGGEHGYDPRRLRSIGEPLPSKK
jgi:hypothetical protein